LEWFTELSLQALPVWTGIVKIQLRFKNKSKCIWQSANLLYLCAPKKKKMGLLSGSGFGSKSSFKKVVESGIWELAKSFLK